MLRELYATPPPDFVATRNDLVKGLRREKRRDDATAVAALRRPGWDDWALNAVAASDPDVVAGFAAAAAEVREAQSAAIEGRDGPDIRGALKDLRERSAELVRLADAALGGVGRQPLAGEINTRLSQVATNDVAVEQLLVGILGSGDTAPRDLFGGLEPADRPAARATKGAAAKRTAKAKADATATGAAERGPTAADAARDAAAERAARAEQARRKEALAAANREHRAAVAARQRAEAEVAKAAAAVDKARAALATAEEALASAEQERDDAQAAEGAASAAADEARAALET